MKKLLLSLVLGSVAAGAAGITPLWMRDVRISPDGKEIAFCYKGDIYKVDASGGEAVRLTSQESYEASPVWSPDGKQIAFSSDRYGNPDVFVMSADGGPARRLTSNSAAETPSAFTRCRPTEGKSSRFWELPPKWFVSTEQATSFFIKTGKASRMNGENIIRLPLRATYGCMTRRPESIPT